MHALSIEGLAKHFPGGSVAVEGISLNLQPGSFTTLLGPSGCGKTTTLRCLAGLEVPDAGRITFGDDVFVDVKAGHYTAPNKRHLGMVFQSYALWPNKSVMANVAYPLRLRGTGRADAEGKARDALSTVGLVGYEHRYPHELSGGQQQRVALARGLVSAQGLLLFDEPLSNLDAKLRLSMRTEIRRLHDALGYSSVYVTHDQEEALAISDYIVVLNQGRVEQAGSPHEIFAKPVSPWVADFVGFDNIFEVDTANSSEERIALVGGGELAGDVSQSTLRRHGSIAFRSADVRFAQELAPSSCVTFRGVVRASSYLGDAYRVEVEVAPDTRVIATIPDSSREQVQEKYLGATHEFAVETTSLIGLD
ncbi:polyamine-transporting ATPase [Microbacterium faecale]|uniref:ABC-type quaternary amine transporter n=1 Tax=Microbacterium faecale TaxID=1804630 RepID=A0A916Y1T7_9MICO|nr:ABC transporter ATP-binding protein [Microbacterium faecale]GGD26820.1 polyamine-transporting ATPase [Microbacterium faecale]